MKRPRLSAQRGSALLLALTILALITTLAGGMVWQQWRAVQIEAAERARAQSAWILHGALDWSRLILREDARADARGGSERPAHDHLGEPWATPLAEARLSTFLAADRDNTDDSGPEAFLSGDIADAQARYNLRNLVGDDGKVVPAQRAVLRRLAEMAALPATQGDKLADALAAAWRPTSTAGTERPTAEQPLAPERFAQLAWLGTDARTLAALAPLVDLLPQRTPVNLNTAPREVIAAILDVDLGTAERLVQVRQRDAFASLAEAAPHLPQGMQLDPAQVTVVSSLYRVRGRMRLDQRIVEESSLVRRVLEGGRTEVVTLARERHQRHTEAP
jgi:general secretion pathway protein K